VRDHDICASFGHGLGFGHVERVGRGEQIRLVGQTDHVYLEAVAHAGLLQVLAEHAVAQADRGEVLHPGEPGVSDLTQEDVHLPEGIRTANTGKNGRVLHHGKHLVGHLHHDRIRIAVRHAPRQRAAARHTESTGVVDDHQVYAAGLLKLGADARTSPAANDRDAIVDAVTKSC